MLFLWIVIGLFLAVVVWLGCFTLLSYFVGRSRRQTEFLNGRSPSPGPEGFYDGSAYLLGNFRVPWLGKSFESVNAKGFNIFTPAGRSMLKVLTPLYRGFRVNRDGNTDAYYFNTSTGPGFRDPGIETFKLDYDSPENPFLIRIILDEIVEVAPQEFLGKVHVKVFPGYYATIGFFGLKREADAPGVRPD
ncbi:MAG: hypothetical protein AB7F88_15395 [Pyrinomonadaceae bacterium]